MNEESKVPQAKRRPPIETGNVPDPPRVGQATLDQLFPEGMAGGPPRHSTAARPTPKTSGPDLSNLAELLVATVGVLPERGAPGEETRTEADPGIDGAKDSAVRGDPETAASLLTLNTRALRAFETILAQARELARSEA